MKILKYDEFINESNTIHKDIVATIKKASHNPDDHEVFLKSIGLDYNDAEEQGEESDYFDVYIFRWMNDLPKLENIIKTLDAIKIDKYFNYYVDKKTKVGFYCNIKGRELIIPHSIADSEAFARDSDKL